MTAEAWTRIIVVAVLFCALFWPNLRRLWLKTNPYNGEANWGHSLFVPIIGLYYLYVHREEFRKTRQRTAWTGLPIMILGILVFGYGIWPGQNDFVKDFAMVVTLFGLVLLLEGWGVIRVAWFPIAFMVCALPWPQLVYSWVAGPLQQLAASVAVWTLKATGVVAENVGTKIHIGEGDTVRTLNVAEACAGLRSLMTFITVAAAVAFLSSRQMWQKLIITASAVPIAIFCNVLRVAGQGLLDHYISQKLSESFAHQFVGLIMLIPAFFLILLVGWILDRIFIEEADARRLARSRAKAASDAASAAAFSEDLIIIPGQSLDSAPAPSPPAVAATSGPAPAPATPSPAMAESMAEATRRLSSLRRPAAKPAHMTISRPVNGNGQATTPAAIPTPQSRSRATGS